MLKKTIEFEDLDGNKITEDYYFHFSKAEIAEMQLSYPGGLAEHMQGILDRKDGAEIITTFKKFLLGSIGRRSEDNRRFIKSEEISREFEQSDAYSEYFMLLCTNADAGAEFVRGIFPGGDKLELPKAVTDVELPTEKVEADKPKDPKDMSREELLEAFKQKNSS